MKKLDKLNREVAKLESKNRVELSGLELGMIIAALQETIKRLHCDDDDGITLFEAYIDLANRLRKVAKHW